MDFHTFKHTNKEFYSAEDIKKAHNEFFVGCRSLRKSIDKHHIPPREYLYMKDKKIYDETYRLAALYISKVYYEEKIVDYKKPDKKKERLEKRQIKDEDIEDEPEEIYLEDHEKFKDDDGKIMEIKMIGKKNIDDIYLKVYDIGKGFKIDEVNYTIIHKNSDYEYDIHYKYFKRSEPPVNSNTLKKIMYLTYNGLIKLLYSNRSVNAIKFQKWATKILFSVQMGEVKDKAEVVSECMNTNIKTVLEVFKKNTTTIPCVYLFKLGKVKDVRETFELDEKYNDEDILYKYGMTCDISRRCKEHEKNYGKMKNVELELSRYCYIDVLYISEAETKLQHYFQALDVIVDNKELVVINKKNEKWVDELYNDVCKQFMGRNTELINKIKDLENQIKIMKKDYELLEKDIELKDKDNELLKIKLELCEYKLNDKK